MARSEIQKAPTVLQGIADRDADLATRYLHPQVYKEHNPYSADGVLGVREYICRLPKDGHLKVVRTFQDGAWVFTQEDGLILGQNTFFDVFRFADGLIVDHWRFAAKAGPPNKSGHTQIDGPTEAQHVEDTEKNKSLVHRYYETFHIRGDHSRREQYFAGDLCIRHEPGVRDGVAEFLRDVSVLMQHRTIDEIRILLGQGDFVFLAARGTHQGEPCAYIDLYRMEDGKIVEHWGFPEMVPAQNESKNNNGML
jgi:predicted SnoaL-like aldol condensation-catalyzing enzyme